MRGFIGGGRAAATLGLTCLLVGLFASSALAVQEVAPGDPGGGFTGATHQTATTSGSATSGAAQNTDSGSQFDMHYGVPSDGTQYSGQVMTQVINADGSVTVQTFPIGDFGNGTSAYVTAWNDAQIPFGGSASISISESNGRGSSFSAGWVVKNFGR